MDGRSFPGIYRGICVDPTDAEGLGRIKVRVPQVTGPEVILTAWPCKPALPTYSSMVPFGVLAPVTVDYTHLVKVGQGVWVMYESGSPDKPVWLGVF